MERNVDMKEISDGKKYHSNDMAKLECNDCRGCSACCHGMGKSIVLDPWDIHMLMSNLECSFQELLEKYIELSVVDGMILPNLRLAGEAEGCPFLNGQGRCSIHAFRPGICRLFPLGRWYEDETFSYFLQTKECKKEKRSKVKISKWLGIPNLHTYENFICQWHYFIKDFQRKSKFMKGDLLKRWNMCLLQTFFATPYERENFYEEFAGRLEGITAHLEGKNR